MGVISNLIPRLFFPERPLDKVYEGGKSRYEAKLIIHCLWSKATFLTFRPHQVYTTVLVNFYQCCTCLLDEARNIQLHCSGTRANWQTHNPKSSGRVKPTTCNVLVVNKVFESGCCDVLPYLVPNGGNQCPRLRSVCLTMTQLCGLAPRPLITANVVEGLVKLLRRMTSGGRLEAWHFQ